VFSQANDAVANALRELIARLIPAEQELLIDAYCGAGFFAKRLLEKFERIIGIDWDKFAIAAAMENATAKENYVVGDVDVELKRVRQIDGVAAALSAAKRGGIAGDTPATTIIADPPATGLTAKTRTAIADLAPGTFIYISCNPATLARDLAELQQSFTIDSVTPLDMFPQTAEIEVAVHLELRREVAKSR
jgi:tRNA/tmRNA/rRNA uracil-C5-methylase (TrmA/RlmC/RlmD family)